MRSAAGALVLLVTVWLGAAALTAAPAQACGCMSNPVLAQQFADAEAVFTGRLLSRTVAHPDDPGERSSADPAYHVFAVDSVLKGAVDGRQEVVSADDGASCGLEIRGTGPQLVFADRRDGELSADLCNGTAELTDDLAAQVEAVARGPLPEASPDPVAAGSGGGGPEVVVVGAAGAAVLIVGAVVMRRTRVEPPERAGRR